MIIYILFNFDHFIYKLPVLYSLKTILVLLIQIYQLDKIIKMK